MGKRGSVVACCAMLLFGVSSAGAGRVADRGDRQANGGSGGPMFSADGRFVTFVSRGGNLVRGDSNKELDIFVRDLQRGETSRVNVSSAGEEADRVSRGASISADGRFVAFHSRATTLVPRDTNRTADVFEHDRQLGVTVRVSVGTGGGQADSGSFSPSVSHDGGLVAFESAASDLVDGDTNDASDVFVHNRVSGDTDRVSIGSLGQQGNGASSSAVISSDGRFVAFWSFASNFVLGDTTGAPDVFVRELATGTVTRIIASESGTTHLNSPRLALSADGRFVAFATGARLVPGDTNGRTDVFVVDREAGSTTRASVSTTGAEANFESGEPVLSADGRVVAFASYASNLVPHDTNQGYDVFARDLRTGVTRRVSVGPGGAQSRARSTVNWSIAPALTANGRVVAFQSGANNFVQGDTNRVFDVFARDRVSAKTVRLSLGRGIPPVRECRVPDVVGLRLAGARSRLEAANCLSGLIRHLARCRVCRVVAQRPRSSARRERWFRVTLWVVAAR